MVKLDTDSCKNACHAFNLYPPGWPGMHRQAVQTACARWHTARHNPSRTQHHRHCIGGNATATHAHSLSVSYTPHVTPARRGKRYSQHTVYQPTNPCHAAAASQLQQNLVQFQPSNPSVRRPTHPPACRNVDASPVQCMHGYLEA